MWQISSADEGTVGAGPPIDDDSKGVAAAEIAMLVPNLRASLRVMCPLIVSPDSQDYIPVKRLSIHFEPSLDPAGKPPVKE
jgi:hypothetical protein